MSEYIRRDEFVDLNMNDQNGNERGIVINAKFDRIDFFPRLGAWVLKAYDDEAGLMSVFIEKEAVDAIVEAAELPVVERDFIFKSEYEGYLKSREKLLEDSLLDDLTDSPLFPGDTETLDIDD